MTGPLQHKFRSASLSSDAQQQTGINPLKAPARQTTAADVASSLFASVTGTFTADVVATEPGCAAGMEFLDSSLAPASAGRWQVLVSNGDSLDAGQALLTVSGTATELGVAEDYVMGSLGFACGIATRAKAIAAMCPNDLNIACGGWKKLPAAMKPLLRSALGSAGVLPRLVPGDFVYLSKNAVTLLGNVGAAIDAGRALNRGPVAVQVKNVGEAEFALERGAGIIMVDTGCLKDLEEVHALLQARGRRQELTLAFGGGVKPEQLEAARAAGADTVDIGRAILDAPLLDLRLQISGVEHE